VASCYDTIRSSNILSSPAEAPLEKLEVLDACLAYLHQVPTLNNRLLERITYLRKMSAALISTTKNLESGMATSEDVELVKTSAASIEEVLTTPSMSLREPVFTSAKALKQRAYVPAKLTTITTSASDPATIPTDGSDPINIAASFSNSFVEEQQVIFDFAQVDFMSIAPDLSQLLVEAAAAEDEHYVGAQLLEENDSEGNPFVASSFFPSVIDGSDWLLQDNDFEMFI
jgi:hypothetical protein